MAATYVNISREEMEDFLRNESRRLKATMIRKPGTEGVYALSLSPFVGIKISTSVGSKGSVVDVGKGAIHVALIALQGERAWGPINKKAAGKTRVNRTIQWAKNTQTMIQSFVIEYSKHKDFYDQLGGDKKPQEEFGGDLLKRIENIPSWNSSNFLKSLHNQIQQGRSLSKNQLNILVKIERKEELLQRLRSLWVKYKDEEIRNILKSLAEQVKRGDELSSSQEELISQMETQKALQFLENYQ